MEPWGATYSMISTPTMSFITPFGMVCTLHFLQCTAFPLAPYKLLPSITFYARVIFFLFVSLFQISSHTFFVGLWELV